MTKIFYDKRCLHLILGHFTAKIIIDTLQSVKAVVEETALFRLLCIGHSIVIKLRNPTARILRTLVKTS